MDFLFTFGNCLPRCSCSFVQNFGARNEGHFTPLLFILSCKFSFNLSMRIFLILRSLKIVLGILFS